MKIGIEAQRIFRPKKHGMDIYALELIRELQRQDQENEYFIFVKKGPDVCLVESPNFHIIEVPGVTYADWEQIWLPRALKKHKVDVLHCTSNTAPVATKVPLVLTLHDIIYLNKDFGGGSWYQRLGHHYRRWNVPNVFKKARKVFTVSAFEKDVIARKLGSAEKVSTVYNGVDAKFRQVAKTKIEHYKKKFGLPNHFIFFLGNTAPKKNMRGMLQAYADYASKHTYALPLVIAESSKDEVMNIIRELGIGENVINKIRLTGYIAHHNLPVYYACADLFVYPSLRESFGIPIIEAMACGTPVITSDTSSMPEVAGGAAQLIDPNEPIQISQAISYLISDPEYRKDLQRLGAERAADFSWTNTAKQVREVYEGVFREMVNI